MSKNYSDDEGKPLSEKEYGQWLIEKYDADYDPAGALLMWGVVLVLFLLWLFGVM